MTTVEEVKKELGVGTGNLSQYVVDKKIGQGQFSVVYRAKAVADGLIVALKRIPIAEMMDKKARDDCIQEIGLLKSLDHPNIIRYVDGFIEGKELIIVLELADAGDLGKMIKHFKSLDKKIAEKTVCISNIYYRKYFVQIASAMKHMHDRRVMHRDLKPANVFITQQGMIKLGDLGLGRFFAEGTVQAHSLVGTPYYMSPERLAEAGYSFQSDIWGLGCLLYELAALHSPFYGEKMNLVGLVKKIEACDYPPLPSDLYSKELRDLVAGMIVNDPDKRLDATKVFNIAKAQYEKLSAK